MSMLGDAIGRNTRARPVPPRPQAAAPTGAVESAAPQAPPAHDDRSELRRRRDALAQQVTELHWDLGGLAYEMAIRDHFRLDVLVRRAAVLQERDAELAEVERLLRLEESASAGACPACSAPHSRGAVFCWQCGMALMQRRAASVAAPAPDGERDEPTAVMDALLATDGSRGASDAASSPFGDE